MPSRGMTLTELMVTLAVVGIVMAGAMQMFVGFSESQLSANMRRETAARGRSGLAFIEKSLRLAGYGLDPSLAIDFNVYKENGLSCVNVGQLAGNDCPARRDRTDGPDELVFYSRDPMYWGEKINEQPEGRAWLVSSATAGSVTLEAHGKEFFPKGQILQLVCLQAQAQSYVMVGTSTTVTTAGSVTVPLLGAETGNPYRQTPTIASCLTNGTARAFLVHRYRYFIQSRTLADGTTQVPFLMLDQGIDRTDDGNIDNLDLVPILADLVDFQVSYARPEGSNLVQEVGGSTAALSFCSVGPPMNPGPCAGGLRVINYAGFGAANYSAFTYLTQFVAPTLRQSPDAPNISHVHIALVTRSSRAIASRTDQPAMLNRATPPTGVNRIHRTTELVVPTHNLNAYVLSYL